MKDVILEGILGEKFGYEWKLDVNSPAEALSAIMAQRPGLRKFLLDSEGVQGYEVFVDEVGCEIPEELVISKPGDGSYTFVPVIGGSKNSTLMMVLGVTLIAVTGGFGAAFVPGFMGTMGTAAVGTAGTAGYVAGTAATGLFASHATLVSAMGYLGTGLALGGAAMMLSPDVPEGNTSEKAENYLFGGPVNTVKQGEPIPLVYGRAIVGSKTISASIFTNVSDKKIQAGRKLVGIKNFRTDGSKSGTGMNTATGSSGFDWANEDIYP